MAGTVSGKVAATVATEEGKMKTRLTCVLVLGLFVAMGFLSAAAPRLASAAPLTATSASSARSPAWWGKYEGLASAATAADVGGGSSSTISVGRNIDVSNEAGPQSETSIAINPENLREIVAGSNEIFRLPMRGYFSSDGGKMWGGVDLPLPPPLKANGIDFGSDPGVA